MDEATKAAHKFADSALSEHTIEDPTLRTKLEKLRQAAKVFSHGIIDTVPAGPERDRILLRIRESFLLAVDCAEMNQPAPDPRIRPARIDEATAQAMRDGKFKTD
jgi:hypothetical protein